MGTEGGNWGKLQHAGDNPRGAGTGRAKDKGTGANCQGYLLQTEAGRGTGVGADRQGQLPLPGTEIGTEADHQGQHRPQGVGQVAGAD